MPNPSLASLFENRVIAARRYLRRLTVLGVCTLALTPLLAQPQTPALDVERVEFVIGNAYFVLLHEVAHMLLNEFDIPVLGNEEEAADTLAATTLIRLDKLSGTDEFRFTRMLLMAGDANRILWKRGIEMQAGKNAYWAGHPLSVQRSTRIACLVYGSDSDAFTGLPELLDIPFFRAGWCEEEFETAERARRWVRDSVKQPKRLRKGGNVSVAYDDPADETHAFIQRWLQQEKILENSAGYVSDNFRMPEDVSFTAMSCGAPNAFWDTEERSVILCYELLAAFYDLGAEQQVRELEMQLRNMASKV